MTEVKPKTAAEVAEDLAAKQGEKKSKAKASHQRKTKKGNCKDCGTPIHEDQFSYAVRVFGSVARFHVGCGDLIEIGGTFTKETRTEKEATCQE